MAKKPQGAARASTIYDPPPGEPGAGAPGSNPSSVAFDPPPEPMDDADPEAETASASAEAEALGVAPELIDLRRALEARIFARAADRAAVRAAAADAGEPLMGSDNVVGVGIGPAFLDFESVGPDGPGAPVLNVYVVETAAMDEVKAALVDDYGARALASDRTPVNVIRTGIIDSLAHRHRARPVPCGISIGHPKVTAGTLGALARGNDPVRNRRLLLLSNNHVIANVNDAAVGDSIMQPARDDAGTDPADRIAVLERWVPIGFGASDTNHVDCATAWCWPDRVRRPSEYLFRSGSAWAHFRVEGAIAQPAIGMQVGKSGRTTQLTSGRIIDISASVSVNYQGRLANFRDQISIRGNAGDFSKGGDSGSLVWTWEQRRRPIGLLFAGGGGITFANKIGRVLQALDITLVT